MRYYPLFQSSSEADASGAGTVFSSPTEKPRKLTHLRLVTLPYLERFLLCLALLLPTLVLLILLRGSSSICALSTSQSQSHQVEREFTTDENYMSLDHAYDFLWADLSLETKGGGQIRTKEEDGQERVAQITMYELCIVRYDRTRVTRAYRFHQLHCLSALRKALQHSREGIDIGIDQHDNAHWPHCMDYLRQVSKILHSLIGPH